MGGAAGHMPSSGNSRDLSCALFPTYYANLRLELAQRIQGSSPMEWLVRKTPSACSETRDPNGRGKSQGAWKAPEFKSSRPHAMQLMSVLTPTTADETVHSSSSLKRAAP
jgi:hypothetical protein